MTLNRRGFVTRLGAAGMSLSAADLLARPVGAPGPWDMSWLEKIGRRQHRVAFDGTVEEDGIAIDHAEMVLDQFKEVFGSAGAWMTVTTSDRQKNYQFSQADVCALIRKH